MDTTVLAKYRKTSGLTQLAASKLAGVHRETIIKIEKGDTDVQLCKLLAYVKILNLEIRILL